MTAAWVTPAQKGETEGARIVLRAVEFRIAIFEYLYAKNGRELDEEKGKKQEIWRFRDAAVLRVIPFQERSVICAALCCKLFDLNNYDKTSAKEISNCC